jgi:hypothetical protein
LHAGHGMPGTPHVHGRDVAPPVPRTIAVSLADPSGVVTAVIMAISPFTANALTRQSKSLAPKNKTSPR